MAQLVLRQIRIYILQCAKSLIQNKIISSEKDYLGIVFFGTEKDKTSYGDFKHIYVLHVRF